MLWQPVGDRFDDRLDFLFGGVFPADQLEPVRIVRRVGLRVAGGRGMDERDGQCAARLGHRMGVIHPTDQLVGQVNDARLAAARIGQFAVLVRFGMDEVDQVLGEAVVKVSKMAWFGSPTRTQLPLLSLPCGPASRRRICSCNLLESWASSSRM
jgi:hypothetical protein